MKKILKPCPFCGGEAELNHEFTPVEKSYVRCRKCGIKGQSFGKAFDYASNDKAIEAWNKRFNISKARRGVWQVSYDEEDPQDYMWKCSVCDHIRLSDDITPTNYCPNCGAKMKGDV